MINLFEEASNIESKCSELVTKAYELLRLINECAQCTDEYNVDIRITQIAEFKIDTVKNYVEPLNKYSKDLIEYHDRMKKNIEVTKRINGGLLEFDSKNSFGTAELEFALREAERLYNCISMAIIEWDNADDSHGEYKIGQKTLRM